MYHSTKVDNFFWYLILRGKKIKTTKTHPNTKLLPIFNGRNRKSLIHGS